MANVNIRAHGQVLLQQVIKEIQKYPDEFKREPLEVLFRRTMSPIALKIMIALDFLIVFPSEISENSKSTIIRNALELITTTGKITDKTLIGQLDMMVNDYLSKPRKPFVFVTHIGVHPAPILKRRTFDGAAISFSRHLQGKFRNEFDQIRRAQVPSGTTVIPYDYQAVKVAVNERTPHDAFTQACTKFDFIRGLWNLELNRHIGMRVGESGYKRPVNRLLLLPFYTIHQPDGTRATSTYWYEFHHLHVYRSDLLDSTDIVKMYSFESKSRRNLRDCAYQDQIRIAIVRYVRALDDPDYHSSFIKMWSILEALVGVTESKTSIKDFRTDIASLFQEPTYNEMVLDSLRLYRNSLIHHEEYSGDEDSVLWATKLYVEQLLVFHLNYGKHFSTINKTMEFIKARSDIPVCVKDFETAS